MEICGEPYKGSPIRLSLGSIPETSFQSSEVITLDEVLHDSNFLTLKYTLTESGHYVSRTRGLWRKWLDCV